MRSNGSTSSAKGDRLHRAVAPGGHHRRGARSIAVRLPTFWVCSKPLQSSWRHGTRTRNLSSGRPRWKPSLPSSRVVDKHWRAVSQDARCRVGEKQSNELSIYFLDATLACCPSCQQGLGHTRRRRPLAPPVPWRSADTVRACCTNSAKPAPKSPASAIARASVTANSSTPEMCASSLVSGIMARLARFAGSHRIDGYAPARVRLLLDWRFAASTGAIVSRRPLAFKIARKLVNRGLPPLLNVR